MSYTAYDDWGKLDEKKLVLQVGVRELRDLVFNYTGHPYDQVIDLYFAQARMYDPATSRWLSPDPVRGTVATPITLNRYSYVRDNPVRYIDPFGLFDFDTVLSMENNKGVYNDDVKVLQNYLIQQDYLSIPTSKTGVAYGYFDKLTCEAITKWKNDITPGSGRGVDFSGTIDLSWWLKTNGIYRSKKDKNAGVEITTIGFDQYFDMTIPITNALNAGEANFIANAGDLMWFFDQVGSENERHQNQAISRSRSGELAAFITFSWVSR